MTDVKFLVLFHNGPNDEGQPLPFGVLYESADAAKEDAATLQNGLTHRQQKAGWRFSVVAVPPD